MSRSKKDGWTTPIVIDAPKTKRRAGVIPTRREETAKEKRDRRPERWQRNFDVLTQVSHG